MNLTPVDALYSFSMDLAAQDLDRGGLTIEVPKRFFFRLAHELAKTNLLPPMATSGRGFRFSVELPWTRLEEAAMATSRTAEVLLGREAIADGLKICMFSSATWTVRLKEPDRTALLELFRRKETR